MKPVAFVLAACLSSASLVVAPRAHAEPPAYVARDVVMLNDGGMVRGNIRELLPNEYVVIDMQGGESRRFAMSEVNYAGTVEGAPGQPAPKAAPAPVRPATDEPTPPAEGVVRMHIDVDNPKVQLHRHEGTSAHWVPNNRVVVTEVSTLICRAPCDQLVDGSKGEEFFFTGNGVTPSSRFQLFDKRGDVSAEVKPGSSAGRVVGFVGAVAGAALVAVGTVSVLLGSMTTSRPELVDGEYVVRESDDPGLKTAGYVMLGTGVAALVGGIWLWVANGTTFELKSGGRSQQSALRQPPSWAFGRF